MSFTLPLYTPPDFSQPRFKNLPLVIFKPVLQQGIAPENYHATSVYPEYFHLRQGIWRLIEKSRMDCVVVLKPDDLLEVKEFRHLKEGDLVACGRSEEGEEGIFIDVNGFDFPNRTYEKFAFRLHRTRETSFSVDYDELYDLLDYEQKNGFIVWVLGPAIAFDLDARNAFSSLIKKGYVHALMAGNALATHDIEGSFYGTALGQKIYTKKPVELGHYKHLDALNRIRAVGSIEEGIEKGLLKDGIMYTLVQEKIPYVLAGSIRDDGPLPEVIEDVYQAQDKMRSLAVQATTVIALATQLHSIAAGNMTPSYAVTENNQVRPVYFYSVDMSEFAVSKLADRGSLTARAILTNVQDFVVNVERGLENRKPKTDKIRL